MRSLSISLFVVAGLALLSANCAYLPGPTVPPATAGQAAPRPTAEPPSIVRSWHQAAVAEGQATVYADLSALETETLSKLFRRRYPDVSIAWVRGLDRDLLQRATNEARDGRPSFDVFVGDLGTRLDAAGLAAHWTPPEARSLPPQAIDPGGAWYGTALTYYVLQYNTELVPPAARPRTYQDLADPRWVGRLVAEEEAVTWLKGLIETWGRQPTVDVLRPLANQGIVLQRGPQTVSQLIGVGRFAVAVANRLDAVERDRRGGAKTGWLPIEPVVTQPTAVVLSARAPHPNAARLVANFLLTADVQAALAEQGRIPTRQDVDPEPQTLVRGIQSVFTLPPEGAAEASLRDLYWSLWRR